MMLWFNLTISEGWEGILYNIQLEKSKKEIDRQNISINKLFKTNKGFRYRDKR